MSTAYLMRDTRDLWRDVDADPTRGQSSHATGAELGAGSRTPATAEVNLWSGLWPVLTYRSGVSSSLPQLLEQIRSVIARNRASAVAVDMSSLWNLTSYRFKVEMNYPIDSPPSTDPRPVEGEQASHSRLAREVREITGLPAVSIGAALGVTREQYQRWVAGSPISDIRHGQLIYLHTIAVDVLRRLGPVGATLWWRTPAEAHATPEDLLKQRRTDRVYQLAAKIPDPEPVVDGLLRGLPVQSDMEFDEDDRASRDEAWSPYG